MQDHRSSAWNSGVTSHSSTRVAVVDGGNAGLTYARALRLGGHAPLVFEADDRLAGPYRSCSERVGLLDDRAQCISGAKDLSSKVLQIAGRVMLDSFGSASPVAPVAPGPLYASQLPPWLVADLRTDHAGESGAVMIYRGILATTGDAAVKGFARAHLATEAAHLAAIEQLLAPQQRSRLLPLWRAAGWLTGALPAWVGPRAVYATIEAVETFVDHHYTEQIEAIDRLDPAHTQASLQEVQAQLHSFRADEINHRDDAAARFDRQAAPPSPWLRLWIWALGAGSRGAVKICRWT